MTKLELGKRSKRDYREQERIQKKFLKTKQNADVCR